MRRLAIVFCAALAAAGVLVAREGDDAYLTWTAAQAQGVGQSWYARGRVGRFFDTRLLKTERAYNYKLAATWLTPDVVRATARLLQLQRRLSDAETRALVHAGDEAGDTVVMVEIDPREGSGVIPGDWAAFLQPRGRPERVVTGTVAPRLRDTPALAGVLRRNYDYDRFWVVFPLRDEGGEPLFAAGDLEAELLVRIYDREGRITWRVPDAIRARQARLLAPGGSRE